MDLIQSIPRFSAKSDNTSTATMDPLSPKPRQKSNSQCKLARMSLIVWSNLISFSLSLSLSLLCISRLSDEELYLPWKPNFYWGGRKQGMYDCVRWMRR